MLGSKLSRRSSIIHGGYAALLYETRKKIQMTHDQIVANRENEILGLLKHMNMGAVSVHFLAEHLERGVRGVCADLDRLTVKGRIANYFDDFGREVERT